MSAFRGWSVDLRSLLSSQKFRDDLEAIAKMGGNEVSEGPMYRCGACGHQRAISKMDYGYMPPACVCGKWEWIAAPTELEQLRAERDELRQIESLRDQEIAGLREMHGTALIERDEARAQLKAAQDELAQWKAAPMRHLRETR